MTYSRCALSTLNEACNKPGKVPNDDLGVESLDEIPDSVLDLRLESLLDF